MKLLFFLGTLALIATYGTELHSRVDRWIGGESDPHVQAAIDLRCQSGPAAFRVDCARELRRDFEAGAREPASIVKRHCTRFSNEWAVAAQRRPLPICTELYGGWIEG